MYGIITNCSFYYIAVIILQATYFSLSIGIKKLRFFTPLNIPVSINPGHITVVFTLLLIF